MHQEPSQIQHPGDGLTWANFGSLQSMKCLDPAYGQQSHGVPASLCSILFLRTVSRIASKGPVTEEPGPPGGSCLCAAATLPLPAMSAAMAMPAATPAPMLIGCRSASESQNNPVHNPTPSQGWVFFAKREVMA